MNDKPSPQLAPSSPGADSTDTDLGIVVVDDVLPLDEQQKIHRFLLDGPWSYGWRSNNEDAAQKFWHRHFAGSVNDPETGGNAHPQRIADCSGELMNTAPLVHSFWQRLQKKIFQDHVLSRCYANALPYGVEGGTHADSPIPGDCTAVYYPHETWHSDWGGETLVFNQDCSDILTAVYPKPNRLFIFPGFVNHVARGVSKSCPHVRITLMFKTTRKRP